MDWFQLIVTIIGSSSLTALITCIFNYKSMKQANKENACQRSFDYNCRVESENKQKEAQNRKQQAENLYKIICPAIKCRCLRHYIKEPSCYTLGAWQALYDALRSEDDDKYIQYSKYVQWLNHCNIGLYNKTDLPFREYVISLIGSDLEAQNGLTEFMQRYNKGTEEAIEIDVAKLNKDIERINKELNLFIEEF